MPIRPEHRWLYPIDWRELSDLIRFRRARGRCEHCRRPHCRSVHHLGDGRWYDEEVGAWRDGRGRRLRGLPAPGRMMPNQLRFIELAGPAPCPTTRVVLAGAHLDHDPGNNAPSNLAALCQRCHMLHDAPEHRRRRWLNAFCRRAIGDLFSGAYG